MEKFKDKKIPITLIVSSFLLVAYSLITKDYDHFSEDILYLNELYKSNFEIPLEYYYVNILSFKIPYKATQFIAIFLLGLGIYWFVYKTDEEIKKALIFIYKNMINKMLCVSKKLWSKENSLFVSSDRTVKNNEVLQKETSKTDRNFNMKKPFKIIGAIIVVFIAIYSFNMIISSVSKDKSHEIIRKIAIKSDLKNSIESVSKKLPMRIDKNTMLIEMKYIESANKIITVYQVMGISNRELNSATPNLKVGFIDFIKNNPNNKEALLAESVFEFIYKDINGVEIQNIKIYPEDYQ